jgi:hypothetical protein
MNAPIVKISHASVRATGWTAKGSEFESQYGQESFLLHVFQTGYGPHPASHPIGNGVSFPEK